MRIACVLAVGLASFGCGGAREGGPCSGELYHCSAAKEILECRGGTWVAVPCSGPQGCSAVAGGLACDITGNRVGDGCPSAMEGSGFCGTAPTALYACQNLTIVKLQDCSSCVVSSGSLLCTP